MTSCSKTKRSTTIATTTTIATVNDECSCENASEFAHFYVRGRESHARYIFGSLLVSFNLIGIKTNENKNYSWWMNFMNRLVNITVISFILNEILVFIYTDVPSIFRNFISTLFVVTSVYCRRLLNRSAFLIMDGLDKYSCLIVADKKGTKFLRGWCSVLTSVGWLFFLGYTIVCFGLVEKYGFRILGSSSFLGIRENEPTRLANNALCVGIVVVALTVVMPLYFCIAFFVMITWFLSCLFSNHCRLTLRTIKIKPPNHKEHIQQSCTLYSHISDLTKVVGGVYNYLALLWIVVSFILILLVIHGFIKAPMKENVTMDCSLFFLPGLVAVFTFVVQCLAGDALIANGKSLIPTLSTYADKSAGRCHGIYGLSEMLIDKVNAGAPCFRVARMIKVDRNLIFVLITGIVTYVATIVHFFK